MPNACAQSACSNTRPAYSKPKRPGARKRKPLSSFIKRSCPDFIQNALEGLHQVGAEGKILWANPAQLRLLGYPASEYVGRELVEFFLDRKRFDEFWDRLMRGEVIYDFPAALRCNDGSIKHVLIHSSGYWEGGKFLYTRCFIRDVTERVELERELKSQAR